MDVNDQLHVLAAFTPWEKAANIHWTGGWVGTRASLNTVNGEKS
jgi:hypothetical protein